jgi:hypothetical protein
MKIAVYTLSLNESKNVNAWVESTRDADYVSVADTGSGDGTQKLFLSHYPNAYTPGSTRRVHQITISPWRFDDAHNSALALVPADADICIPLHLDERLQPGWRKILEDNWVVGVHTKAFYTYVFSHNPDGTPGFTFLTNRIHARSGYRWRYPDHEGVYPYGAAPEKSVAIPALRIEHFQDRSKDRTGILNRLAMGMTEYPDHSRMVFYYARELMYRGNFSEAVKQFERYFAMGESFPTERAQAAEHLSYCWKRLS